MKIEMKWYIFLSVQQLRQIATLKRKLRWETGLLITFLEDDDERPECEEAVPGGLDGLVAQLVEEGGVPELF